MEFTVEETMLIINALTLHNKLFVHPTGELKETILKRNEIINKLKKQVIGKTKIVRVKK